MRAIALFSTTILMAAAVLHACSAESREDEDGDQRQDAAAESQADGSASDDASGSEAGGASGAVPEQAWPKIEPSDAAYLIIFDDTLSDAAAELAAFREATEASVTKISMSSLLVTHPGPPDEAVGEAVKQWAEGLDASQPGSVLLFGDAQAVPPREILGRSRTVGPSITSDNAYADLDDDGIPELAVGRIPARTEEEARVILDKIYQHESAYEPGPWNRRIHMFASQGGFGQAIDQIIEDVALQVIDPLNNAYDVSMTYGSQTSEFVFPPEKLSDKVYERMNEGSFFMAYLGHGYETGFAPMTWNGVSYPIFDTDELDELRVQHRAPLLALIACNNATFDAEQDSIAERILKQPRAPSSVFGATEISHPYSNTVLVREVALNLIQNEPRPVTAGELYMRAKQTAVSNHDDMRQTIDTLAVALLQGDDAAVLIEEALQMYVLLGDPAMRIVYPPYRASVQTDRAQYHPGETVKVSVDTAGLAEGTALVTLESARSVFLKPIQAVPPDGDSARDGVIEKNYRNANDKVIDYFEKSFSGESISAVFVLEEGLPVNATYYIKVLAEGERRDSIGVGEIRLVE